MNIVLIGFMCSGKSSVGRLLARRLGRPHVDTDQMVEVAQGRSVADMIRADGEPAFRAAERAAVKQAAAMADVVISTGGGVPLDPANMDLLKKSGRTIWLKVSPAAVLRRAGALTSRPLIDAADPEGSVRRRLAEREPLYAAADAAIDTEGLPPEAVVDAVLAALSEVRS